MIIDLILPKSWADLTPNQMVGVMKLYDQQLQQSGFLLRALMLMTRMRPVIKAPVRDAGGKWFWFKVGKQKPILIGAESLRDASNKLEFLLEPVCDAPAPRWKGSCLYQAPRQKLYNLSVEQYLYAENLASAYGQSKDTKILPRLMAVLWVSKVPWLNKAFWFKRLDPVIQQAVFLFYAGARKALSLEFPHLFKPSNGSGEDDVTAMIRALNNGDVTKNDAILKTQLWDALKQLEDMAIQAEEIKKQMKR